MSGGSSEKISQTKSGVSPTTGDTPLSFHMTLFVV